MRGPSQYAEWLQDACVRNCAILLNSRPRLRQALSVVCTGPAPGACSSVFWRSLSFRKWIKSTQRWGMGSPGMPSVSRAGRE
jgi:hypothetical protein